MKTSRKLLSLLALTTALGATGTPAEAVGLLAKSPGVTQIGGFASWVQDQNGLALQGCLDTTPPLKCILPAAGEEAQFNPAAALSFPGPPVNFPSEHFYFFTEATLPGSGSLVRMAIEGAFLPTVAQGNQEMFHRFRIRVPVAPVSGTLVLDHPWGTTTFTGLDCTAGLRCDATFDVNAGSFATNFVGITGDAPEGSISRFLVQSCPGVANPVGFIGDGVTPCPVVADAGLVRTNVAARIGATDLGSTNLFIVAGKKVGMDVSPSPVAQLPPAVIDAVGVTPTKQTVTITNLTGALLDLTAPTALAITGPNAAEFVVAPAGAANTCTTAPIAALAPNNTCIADVTFTPPTTSTVAARTASLAITPADLNAAPAVNVALNGKAQFRLEFAAGANGTVTNEDGSPALATDVVDAGANKVYKVTPANVPGTSFLPLVKANGVRMPVVNGTATIPAVVAPQATAVTFLRAGDVNQNGGNPALDDALRALRIAVGIGAANPTDEEIVAADVGPLVNNVPTPSGKVTAADALLILKRSLNLDPAW